MRSLVAIIAVSALLVVTGAAGAAPPAFPNLPGDWTHAEINVTIKGVPHTLVLDRGRLGFAGPRRLAIREQAGTPPTIVLMTGATIVTINGVRARPRQLARGMTVETMGIDGGPAVRVRATF
jgi:hypothetical protein